LFLVVVSVLSANGRLLLRGGPRRRAFGVLAGFALVAGILAAPAGAAPPNSRNMSLEYFDPKTDAVTSDIAFWGNTAFVGN
jgi:hypothetical protein